MAKPPPTRPSIKVTKQMPYRGGTQHFSNRYFFAPTDNWTSATFNTMVTWLVAAEKLALTSLATYLTATGYDAGSEVPVFTTTLSGTGSGAGAGGQNIPGDCAAVLRFSTDQRSVKNHPIYLFKYYHCITGQVSPNQDELLAAQVTELNTLGDTLLAGHNDGTVQRELCGPRGAVAQQRLVLSHVRHRDFVT